jgi:hypothetical protein
VVVEAEPSMGIAASLPTIHLRPELGTIRLRPKEAKRLIVQSDPDAAWRLLENLTVTFDPPVKELQVVRSAQVAAEEVALTFAEPDEFDDDEYPIETALRAIATFKGSQEPRLLERRVVVMPKRPGPTKPKVPLKDDPTFVRVTSRQPIRFVLGGPDLHVRLRWDGKDELLSGNPPAWSFRTTCESASVDPLFFTTRPIEGRFELLIQEVPGLTSGEQLKFDVEAVGPGRTLATALLVSVTDPAGPRRITAKLSSGGQRRPPYELVYVKRADWGNTDLNCFGQPWSGEEAGSFDPPSAKAPLLIFINQDMDLLANYRESLLAKKLAEATIQQRVNKYTAHVAFHLYQMHQNKRQAESQREGVAEVPTESLLRDEIRRVANTLVKLMEVTA